jgi:NAD(P)-dependent dehydrogenase (short-subunit alcohol dehydrogenase family)
VTPSLQLDFTGQTVLITGATRGIGRQMATDFASLGATVILTGTREAEVREVAESLGPRHRAVAVDFADDRSTDAFLAAVAAEPRIDVLVNNAGINRINPVDAILDEDWDAIQRVNLQGPLRLLRTVSRTMKKAGYGRVVNVSSIFGIVSKEKRALYSMSKFGIRGLTVAASHDFAQFGILVNAVSPGFVRTELTDRMLNPEQQAALAAQVPIKRFATPDEISRVVVFLASSLNTYITGETVVADGGFISG